MSQGREATIEAQKVVQHFLEQAREGSAPELQPTEADWVAEQLTLMAVAHVKGLGTINPNVLWLRRVASAVVALERLGKP